MIRVTPSTGDPKKGDHNVENCPGVKAWSPGSSCQNGFRAS